MSNVFPRQNGKSTLALNCIRLQEEVNEANYKTYAERVKNDLLRKENQRLKGYNEYLRNIIKECEPYIENVCIALDMEKFANGGFLHKSNELLSKIRTAIGEKK